MKDRQEQANTQRQETVNQASQEKDCSRWEIDTQCLKSLIAQTSHVSTLHKQLRDDKETDTNNMVRFSAQKVSWYSISKKSIE
jgi:hypothetical protein